MFSETTTTSTSTASSTSSSPRTVSPVASLTESLDADAKLLRGLLADDPSAWRTFNTRYARLVYSCISRVMARFSGVTSGDDVREVYATLCVQLLANDKKKLRSFEASRGTKLGSWLGMLAVHAAYDHLRSVRRTPLHGSLVEAETLILIALRLGYLTDDQAQPVAARITELDKMLTALGARLR